MFRPSDNFTVLFLSLNQITVSPWYESYISYYNSEILKFSLDSQRWKLGDPKENLCENLAGLPCIVKPVWNSHSQKYRKLVFKTKYR